MSFKSHQLLAMKFKLKISKEALLPEYGGLVFLFPFFFFSPPFAWNVDIMSGASAPVLQRRS